MSFRARRVLAAVVAATVGGVLGMGPTLSSAADMTEQQMADQLKALQAKVDQMGALQAKVDEMEARQEALNKANQQTTADLVAKDAKLHDQLLDIGGLSAGYADNRFYIGSEDGDFVLRPWIHVQIRDTTTWRHGADYSGTEDDTQNGFELRRARLGFDGNLFGKDLTYAIDWATNRQNSTLTVKNSAGATVGTTTAPVGGAPILEEAWVKYHFPSTPYYFKVGQMHDPLDHENIVGSKFRAPEASLQGDIFGNTDTFTQAATFIYDPKESLRFEGGVTDGIRAANTPFEDYPNNGVGYDGGLAGRVEYKVMGNWKDYDQLTSYGDSQDLLVLGSGADYSYANSYYTLSHTLDVQYANTAGWFAYICYFGRYTNHQKGIPNAGGTSVSYGGSPADLGKDSYEPSILAQVAYLIDGKIEPFARYEYLRLAGTPVDSQNNVNDFSLGLNYYFHGHNLKFTGMMTYLPDGIPITDDSADILISNNKSELVFLTQLQLLL
jgi:hypothetical protein